jgi:hypothetical protein
MEVDLVRLVWRRAKGRCEYCLLSQEFDDRSFEIDHIVSRKHLGRTDQENLALSCFRCNSFKGSNISGIDPDTHKATSLFNPCRHKWSKHFHWNGARLIGRTPIGRVTIYVLKINDPFRVALREQLILEEVFPPETM